ncbi:hypothetical protein K7432_006509 [Basidiobolus ranarum]|uniref:Pleckstrin homology domain-containing protein n=1 Tax=Basidiobolus ranarum TaxID=34480 RepID=A0ABR2W1I0_9FUNG
MLQPDAPFIALESRTSREFSDSEDELSESGQSFEIELSDFAGYSGVPSNQNTPQPSVRRFRSFSASKLALPVKFSAESQIRELEAKLVEKENEVLLAADIGQVLLKEIDSLKHKVAAYEHNKPADDLSQEIEINNTETVQKLRSFRVETEIYTSSFKEKTPKIPGSPYTPGRRTDRSGTPGLLPINENDPDLTALPPSALLPSKNNTSTLHSEISKAVESGENLMKLSRQLQTKLLDAERESLNLAERCSEQDRQIAALKIQAARGAEYEAKSQENTWNLELQNQELQTQVDELEQVVQKLTGDQGKLQESLLIARESIDQLNDKEEKLNQTLEKAKTRHEQEIMSVRKLIGSLQREKAELNKKNEELKSELSGRTQRAGGRPLGGSTPILEPAISGLDSPFELSDAFELPPARSPSPSPFSVPSAGQTLQVETLTGSLGHAHRTIANLRSSLHREKIEKMEMKKMLAESQETVEALQKECMWESEDMDKVMSNVNRSVKKRMRRKKTHMRQVVTKSELFDDDIEVTESPEEILKNKAELTDELSPSTEEDLSESSLDSDSQNRAFDIEAEQSNLNRSPSDGSPLTPIPNRSTTPCQEAPGSPQGSLRKLPPSRNPLTRRSTLNPMPSRDLLNELTMFDRQPKIEEVLEKVDIGVQTIEPMALKEVESEDEKKDQGVQVSLLDNTTSTLCASCGVSVHMIHSPLDKKVEPQVSEFDEIQAYLTVENSDSNQAKSISEVASEMVENSSEPKPNNDDLESNAITAIVLPTNTETPLVTDKQEVVSLPSVIEDRSLPVIEELEHVESVVPAQNEQSVSTSTDVHNVDEEVKDISPVIEVANPEPSPQEASIDVADSEASQCVVSQNNESSISDTEILAVVAASSLAADLPLSKTDLEHDTVEDMCKSIPTSEVESVQADSSNTLELTNGADVDTLVESDQSTNEADHQSMPSQNTYPVPAVEVESKRVPHRPPMWTDSPKVRKSIDSDRGSPSQPEPDFESEQNVEIGDKNGDITPTKERNVAARISAVKPRTSIDKPASSSPLSRENSLNLPLDTEQDDSDIPDHALHRISPRISAVKSRPSQDVIRAALENFGSPLKSSGAGFDNESEEDIQYSEAATQVSERSTTGSPILWSRSDAGTQTDDINLLHVLPESNNVLFTPPLRPTTPPPPGLMVRSLSPVRVDRSSLRMADEFDLGKNPEIYHQAGNHRRPPIPVAMLFGGASSPVIPPPTHTRTLNHRRHSDGESDTMIPESSTIRYQSTTSYPSRRMKESTMHAPTYGSATIWPTRPMSATSPRGLDTISSSVTDSSFTGDEESWLDHRRTFSADPAIIHAITQAMIGNFMWKYTRRVIGGGISEKKHMRYFWIHPYAKTINWSTEQPGPDRAINRMGSKSKSAYVKSIRVVQDSVSSADMNTTEFSLIVQTATRELKIKSLKREKHDIWLLALTYLQSRHSMSASATQKSVRSPHFGEIDQEKTPQRRTLLSVASTVQSNLSPLSRSVSKKHSLGRLFKKPSKSTLSSPVVDINKLEEEDREENDDDMEINEDVRKCCDGKHDIGKLHGKLA